MIFNAYQNSKEGLLDISIVSSGHIFAQSGRSIIRPFGREDWLLFYVVKGTEKFELSGSCLAKEGSFIIFKPGEKQIHTYMGDETGEFYYVHFTAPDSFSPFGFETSKIYFTKHDAAITDLFEEIISELHFKKASFEKLCVSLLFVIFSHLERNASKSTFVEERYTDKISFVIHKMNKEYNTNTTLEEYSSLCNMSKFHFIRVFKSITGFSPLEYRNRIRLEHAKSFLNSSNTIGEISERLGYSSQNYFCDAFKKSFGISPVEYRRKIKESDGNK